MGIANATIANAEDYQRVLRTSSPVFMLFVSEHCGACVTAAPLFELIAGRYPSVVSLVLDCAQTPRHPEVTVTPTLLIFVEGTLMEKLKGFGPEDEQAQLVEETFKRYAQRRAATAPGSLDAPPPPPP